MRCILERLRELRWHLGVRVTAIHTSGQEMMVETIDRKEQKETLTAKDVILAIPPSVWSYITFDAWVLQKPMPQMGENVKCLMSFKTEYWKKSKLSPNLTSGRALELTWHATEGQKGRGHALVGFSGARQAEACMSWKPSQRTANYISELSRAYRGTEKELVDARFKDWPADHFVRASDAFPAKGEIITWARFSTKASETCILQANIRATRSSDTWMVHFNLEFALRTV